MQIIPTILCGGAGSRLWPVSRALHPKPFIRLNDGQSLLQKAFLRGAALPQVTDILTITNQELFFKIKDEYSEVERQGIQTHFILEPFGKNTGGAIAIAAKYVADTFGSDAVLLILAADHLIQLHDAFQNAVERAVSLACEGHLVTFGIEPERPETGYGYIEVDSSSPLQTNVSGPAGFKIQRFIEKPDLEHAKSYLESGKYLWNSGMFCFTAGNVLEKMALACPDILFAANACYEASRVERHSSKLALDPMMFSHVSEVSFDYAVMEPLSLTYKDQSSALAVVPCAIGWTDIGSWGALGDLSAPDEQGNRIIGDVILKNTHHCTIHSQNRLIGTVGGRKFSNCGYP